VIGDRTESQERADQSIRIPSHERLDRLGDVPAAVARELAGEAEVDQSQSPILEDQEISRMGIGVETPILENLGEDLAQREACDLLRDLRIRLRPLAVSSER